MPNIEGLDPTIQMIGTAVFVIAVAIFSAYSFVKGKKPEVETKEFAVSGQLADMGPVKELVEQAGLLFQQQVRTNLQLEATAAALQHLCTVIEDHIEEQRREKEIAEEVARQLKEKR